MTLAPFAAGSPGTSIPTTEYQPGVCNIGPAEIAKRRRGGHIGVIGTIVVFAVLVAIGAPHIARAILVLPAAVAASGYLQARLRFCTGFGALGLYNFGALGTTEHVEDPEAHARDRARGLRINLASLGIGVAVAVVAVLLPV